MDEALCKIVIMGMVNRAVAVKLTTLFIPEEGMYADGAPWAETGCD
jgi:hypothetical protein